MAWCEFSKILENLTPKINKKNPGQNPKPKKNPVLAPKSIQFHGIGFGFGFEENDINPKKTQKNPKLQPPPLLTQ